MMEETASPSLGDDKRKGKGKGKDRVNSTANPLLFQLTPLRGDDADTDVNSWGNDPGLVVHQGVFCQGPQCSDKQQFIQGIRYHCTVCTNVDFDEGCMQDPENPHDRKHKFWACRGMAIFDDRSNSDPGAIAELDDDFAHVPPEYIRAPEVATHNGLGFASQGNALDLKKLGDELFGANNHISDDPLLIHWQNGVPAAKLVLLLPGHPQDDLECLFTSTELNDPIPYEALCSSWVPNETNKQPADSYTSRPSIVYIGEQHEMEVEVMHATADAMRSLRSTDDVKTLWIEELCVQTRNPDIKAFQERSISLIYQRAERTIIWAGKQDEHMGLVALLIECLASRCEKKLSSPADIAVDEELEELDLLPIGSSTWHSLMNFFPPHLFTQGWLLHDVAFASKAIVMCGKCEIEWSKVDRVRVMLAQPSWTALDWPQPAFHVSDQDDELYI